MTIAPAKLKMVLTFEKAVYDKSAHDLYSARNVKFDELSHLIDKIDKLKDQSSYTRASKGNFKRLKTKSEELVTLLTNENRNLCTALFKLTPKITDDLSYKADQKEFRGWIEKLEDALALLEVRLEEEGVLPAEPDEEARPAAPDLSSLLLKMDKRWSESDKRWSDQQKQLSKQIADTQRESQERQDRQQRESQERQASQDKHWSNMHKQLGQQYSASQKESKESLAQVGKSMADALKASGKAKFKRIQPTFAPKREIDDYSLYRAFKRDFDHFIQDVDADNWADKARWIVQCVKDDAYELIKDITLDQPGYTQAFQVLDEHYLCTDEIKDKIFHYIDTFAVPNTGKNHSTLSSKLIQLKNYINELINSHGFEMNDSFREFLGHKIIKGFPNDVKKQFYLAAATLYPNYDVILSKVNEVIKTLNKVGLNTKDSTTKHNSKNSSNNTGKSEVINSVTNVPSNSSKSGHKSKNIG